MNNDRKYELRQDCGIAGSHVKQPRSCGRRTTDGGYSESDEPDPVMFNIPLPISIGGFWLGGPYPPVASARHPRAICHPGQGGSIGWADPETNFAVAICHKRMFNASSLEEDPMLPIANAVREALSVSCADSSIAGSMG